MSRKRVIDTDIYFDHRLCSLLGDRGLHLYIRLWGISDDSGVYEPHYPDIALKMGALYFTDKEVKNAIEKLMEAGKIIPFTSNGVVYHWLKNFHKHQQLKNPSLPKFPLPNWMSFETKRYASGKLYAIYQVFPEKMPETAGSLPVAYPKERKETKRNETKPKEGTDESFLKFWELYPKKKARADAEKAWRKINPSPELCQTIFAAVEAQKGSPDWQKDGGKFIPFGSTWLNGQRWKDESHFSSKPSIPEELKPHPLLELMKKEQKDGVTNPAPA